MVTGTDHFPMTIAVDLVQRATKQTNLEIITRVFCDTLNIYNGQVYCVEPEGRIH